MKHQLLYILLFAISITSCQLFNADSLNQPIVGKWRWTSSTGGFAGMTYTPDSAGYPHNRITFSNDNTFAYFKNDSLAQKGQFQLEKDKNGTRISYWTKKEGFFPDQYATLPHRDTLILIDNCADCYRHVYVRINK